MVILLLILLFLALLYVLLSQPQKTALPNNQSVLPTKFQTNPSPAQIRGSGVIYSEQGTEKLMDKIDNKVPLSKADQQVKQKILSSIGGQSAVLKNTDDYHIEYIKSLDIFMVEIDTTEIETAKKQASEWFISQGFSIYALCDLPVNFYLSWNAKQQLQSSKTTFNPLADGC